MLRRVATVSALALVWAAPARALPPPSLPLPRTVTTAHVAVHYTTAAVPDAITDAAAQTLAANAEAALATFRSWGYPAPVDDGDGHVDIDVWNFPVDGAAGVASTSVAPGTPGSQFPGKISIKAQWATGQALVAHELFHLVQYAMDAFAPSWLLEAGARWSEHTGPWHDGWASAPDRNYLTHPEAPFDCNAATCESIYDGGYERWLFWSFLSNRYGNGFQHEVYDALRTSYTPGLVATLWQTFDSTLAAHGSTLARTWNDFAVANAARSYPAVAGGTQTVATQKTNVGTTVSAVVPHLAAHYVELLPSSSTCADTPLHVQVTGSKAGTPYVVLGAVATATVDGAADVTWATCGAHPIVVLPNASSSLDGQQFTVTTSAGGSVAGDPAPTLTVLGVGSAVRLSAARPVLALDASCNSGGRVEVALGGTVLTTVDVNTGTNTLRVPLPRARKGTRAQIVLTSLSPGGTRGAPVRLTVVFG